MHAALGWRVSLLLAATSPLPSPVHSLLLTQNLVFTTTPRNEARAVPRGHGHPHLENRYFKPEEAVQFARAGFKSSFLRQRSPPAQDEE